MFCAVYIHGLYVSCWIFCLQDPMSSQRPGAPKNNLFSGLFSKYTCYCQIYGDKYILYFNCINFGFVRKYIVKKSLICSIVLGIFYHLTNCSPHVEKPLTKMYHITMKYCLKIDIFKKYLQLLFQIKEASTTYCIWIMCLQ